MNQYQIEHLLSIHHLENELKDELQNHFKSQITKAKQAILKWCSVKEWDSKNERKHHVSYLDLDNLILNIITKTVLFAQKPMPFVSIASILNIGFMDKMDNIRTTSELLVLLEPIGVYEIQTYGDGTKVVEALVMPSEQLELKLHHACYIPPMIEKPDTLYKNNDCGLKTIDKDSLILGFKENYHTNNISLDVLNTLNSNEYELDMNIINNHKKQWHRDELEPTQLKELDSEEQEQYQTELSTWINFQEQFDVFVKHLKDKTVYITNKVDKRGRVYAQGYHITTQGTGFEKACINLKHKELITGNL